MSKFEEYLKLIPRALENPKEVIGGWVNVVKEELGTLDEELAEKIVERRLICGTCPFMSENAKKLQGYETKRDEAHCILCSCPIKSKTANPESVCGADYYNRTHPDKEKLPVRWLAL